MIFEITPDRHTNLLDGEVAWQPGDQINLHDHLGGFDENFNNALLQTLQDKVSANSQLLVFTGYIADEKIRNKYPNLILKYYLKAMFKLMYSQFNGYNVHPDIDFKNFVCSFNGTNHVSRNLLTACLHKFDWFNPEYSSKNQTYSVNTVDGHIKDFVPCHDNFYRKFFISEHSEDFFQTVYTFGHNRFGHSKNIFNLEHKITKSFLHIVSETMATSYVPFVTEKFLYSIVTRGLFLAYAQPGWHEYLEKYYGFKKYNKLFDYRFDSITNPVERLIELITMVGKFKNLSVADWTDLYQLELDTIEYNYDHYFSSDYVKRLTAYT